MARQYSVEEIDLGLTAFALEGGRGKQVEAVLAEAGIDIPLATIRNWAYKVHKERYEQISIEVEKQVRTRLKDQYHRLAKISAKLSEDLLERIQGILDDPAAEVELRDLAKLLHEAGWAGGVATDKLQILTGRPTQIVEHDFTELQRALEQKGVRLQVGAGQPPKKVPNLDA